MPNKNLKAQSSKLKTKSSAFATPYAKATRVKKATADKQNSKLTKLKVEGVKKSLKVSDKKPVTSKITEKKTRKLDSVSSVSAGKVSKATESVSKVKLTANVYDLKGKIVEEIELPKEIFGAKINKGLISQAVRIYLANQRLGTASVKTRGEVNGSTRKIYKQKGTGRARHGAKKAPIFVHGGIAFGPHPRDLSLKFPKKMKKAALFSALSSKLKAGEVKVIAGLGKIEPKTKIMAGVIKNLDLLNKKVLLVLPVGKEETVKIVRAARNIEGINQVFSNSLNTYEVLNNNSVLLAKEALDSMEKLFLAEKGE